jgi:activator of HSP90 ATPase
MQENMMSQRENLRARVDAPTRRKVIVGGTIAFAGLALGSTRAQPKQATSESQYTESDKRTFLHQEVEFNASPERIYKVLLDSKQFSAFTGDQAEISPEAGGTFSVFGGRIVGRNIELVPNQRIVQAWREASWDPGVYSLVKFELTPEGSKTKVVLDHTGFGEGDFGHLNPGWKLRYWDPLEKFLAGGTVR